MINLSLEKKTGFKNNYPYNPVNVWDKRGTLFYSTEPLLLRGKGVHNFNLPSGDYTIDCDGITKMQKPVRYKLVSLPWPERHYPKPFRFKVKFGVNPNKCSIMWADKTILFDNAFRTMPIPVCDFVLCHEFGHELYQTEKYADAVAGNYMKKLGYNPSQIGSAPVDTLSDAQYERKLFMIENLLKYR